MKTILIPLLALVVFTSACSDTPSATTELDQSVEDADQEEFFTDELDEDLAQYWEMEAEDCLPDELYDEEEQICFIECDTEEECDAKAEEIYSDVDEYFIDDFEGPADSHSNENEAGGEESEDDDVIASYTLDANLELTEPNGGSIVSDHEQIWAFVSRILPRQALTDDVDEFHIFTDGADETLAYVAQTDEDYSKWLIAIDIEDAQSVVESSVPSPDFVHTVVHEFGHIVALENNQVDPDFDFDANNCSTLDLPEGCPVSNSYLAQYYAAFWAELADEIPEEDDQEAADAFYDKYTNRFVSEYAATNPVEDLAESFAAYVLQSPPEGATIADDKVRFFSQFKELEVMRSSIRSQLARN